MIKQLFRCHMYLQYIDTALSFIFSIVHCWFCDLFVFTIQPYANCYAV